jgi:hypothetical protein
VVLDGALLDISSGDSYATLVVFLSTKAVALHADLSALNSSQEPTHIPLSFK